MIALAEKTKRAASSWTPGHISPSAAKSYLGCSLRFFFERIARIAKPTSASLQLGKAVHAALQQFHLARWREGDTSLQAVLGDFDLAFIELEEAEGPVQWPDASSREKAREAGRRMLEAYAGSKQLAAAKPRGVEVRLTAEIDGLDVPLTGVIDLVEESLTPVDFKTAASKPDPEQAAFDHELQLVTYQLLIEESSGVTPPSLDLIHLVKTKTPQVIRIQSRPADRQRKSRVVALLQTAVEGISESRFHPQPGMHCSWCQYREECMAWTGGAP